MSRGLVIPQSLEHKVYTCAKYMQNITIIVEIVLLIQ